MMQKEAENQSRFETYVINIFLNSKFMIKIH